MTTDLPPTRGPGGLLGLLWIAVWGFSGFFLSYATMVPISLDLGLSAVTGGTLLAIMMVAVIAVQPAVPAMRLRWGPRRTIATSLLLMVLGHGMGLVIPHPVVGLLMMGLAVGCGFGILVVVATAAVPAVAPPGRVGRALGQFGATTSSAAAVSAPVGLWFSGVVTLETFRIVAMACVLLAFGTLRGVPGRALPTGPAAPSEPVPTQAEPVPAESSLAAPSAPETRTERVRGSGADVVAGVVRWWKALGPVLLPFVVGMAANGLVIAFGPGGDTAHPAVFIATMQVASVVGRWISGSMTDRRDAVGVYTVGIVMTGLGLLGVALTGLPWLVAASLVVMGLGIGAVQSGSLVLAFARARSHGQASVGWNMGFDTGLALAGVFGGVGFTYLGPSATFAGVAGLILLAGAPLWVAGRRGR